jgi:hypothetical protein
MYKQNQKAKLIVKTGNYEVPGALCHYNAVIYDVNDKLEYIDVVFRSRKTDKNIRMFWNEDENRYVHYNNENNTRIYLHKVYDTICTRNRQNNFGLQNYVDSLKTKYNIDDVLLYVRKDKQFLGAIEIADKEVQYEEVLITNFVKLIGTRIGGLSNPDFNTMLKILFTYPVSATYSIMSFVSHEDINKISEICYYKTKAIKERDYEKAACLRDDEKKYLDTIIIRK